MLPGKSQLYLFQISLRILVDGKAGEWADRLNGKNILLPLSSSFALFLFIRRSLIGKRIFHWPGQDQPTNHPLIRTTHSSEPTTPHPPCGPTLQPTSRFPFSSFRCVCLRFCRSTFFAVYFAFMLIAATCLAIFFHPSPQSHLLCALIAHSNANASSFTSGLVYLPDRVAIFAVSSCLVCCLLFFDGATQQRKYLPFKTLVNCTYSRRCACVCSTLIGKQSPFIA